MSVGEIVGLALATLLAGLLVGVWVGGSIQRRSQLHLQWRRDRLRALARWLSARRSQSRASGSLVAAFRFLASEPPGTANCALRRDEAQRARAFWCETMSELNRAEARLIVQGFICDEDPSWSHVDRVEAEALQRSINGTNADVRRFLDCLESADERACDIVRAAVKLPYRRNPGRARRMTGNVVSWIERILDGWSQA